MSGVGHHSGDDGQGFAQLIAAGVAHAGMESLDAGFGLFPVAAEWSIPAYGLLRCAQGVFMALKTVERCNKLPSDGSRLISGQSHQSITIYFSI